MRKRLIEVERAATLALVGKALDRIRSVYELSPPARRIPLVREADLTSKPLRVERRAGARRATALTPCWCVWAERRFWFR